MVNGLCRVEDWCRVENNWEQCRIWSLLRAPDLGNASGYCCRRLKIDGNAASYRDEEGVVAVIRTGTS